MIRVDPGMDFFKSTGLYFTRKQPYSFFQRYLAGFDFVPYHTYMRKINKHPIIRIEPAEETSFTFRGRDIKGRKGFTLASALHQAGFPVHSHSITGGRNRGLSCGIGKCGACEMLVDGEVKRICITLCDGVKKVEELPASSYLPEAVEYQRGKPKAVLKTTVAVIGAGPAGLAARAKLREFGIACIVIDNQDRPGGQFSLQTHRFFFFEETKKYGNKRGFEIAEELAGDDQEGIFLNCTVWDIFEDRTLAVKNIHSGEIFYIACEKLVVATGAVPLFPVFENDDLPGVYSAAVVQKMMNRELTLLGRNVLTVGAGNIGYLTSYQLIQAGARVKAIIEAQPAEGGFPVQANRLRRLGIPILTGKILLEAVPGDDGKGIAGAVIADARNFQPVPGTERLLQGIDLINICTGLAPDNKLVGKGREIFGVDCHGAGDTLRINEGTSAVIRGTQAAYEIVDSLGIAYDYESYLSVSKAYLESQQRPIEVLSTPALPPEARRKEPFALIDCLYGFACNPCTFSCPQGAITKASPRFVPEIDYEKCIGCMTCVRSCPGMAIFGFDPAIEKVFLALEFEQSKGERGFVVDNEGRRLADAIIEDVRIDKRGTRLLQIDVRGLSEKDLLKVRGFASKTDSGDGLDWAEAPLRSSAHTYICHCGDVQLDEILEVVGGRTTVSLNEIKHTTRLAMGPCRGKKCIPRLRQVLHSHGIRVTGEPTPRAPLANLVELGELYPTGKHDRIILPHGNKRVKMKVGAFVAGGGIAGSALFRYLAEEGLDPVMINHGLGSSWRNIGAGRPVFGLPELSEIARANLEIFRQLQKTGNIDLTEIHYLTMAHDEKLLQSLEASLAWQKGEIIEAGRFSQEISPYFNPDNKTYLAALKTGDCWHAVPGKTIDLIRHIGLEAGGTVHEQCELIDVTRKGDNYLATVRDRDGKYSLYESEIFINALGSAGNTFTGMLGIDTGLYAVKHEAFITRRLHNLGKDNTPLPMLIDRRAHHGFTAVYGYQLAETGQIIGCASPGNEHEQTGRNLKVNSRDFFEIVAETFVDWLPVLSSVGFQAVWSGYYIEPRMIIDPERGLFLGLRGQGFMLGQYLARLYVDTLLGRRVPDYYKRLKLDGDGLVEKAMK